MKFRIMQDEYGGYVQRKSFGIWWNWLVHENSSTILGKRYYNNYLYSSEELESEIIRQNKPKDKNLPKLIKEFEIEKD